MRLVFLASEADDDSVAVSVLAKAFVIARAGEDDSLAANVRATFLAIAAAVLLDAVNSLPFCFTNAALEASVVVNVLGSDFLIKEDDPPLTESVRLVFLAIVDVEAPVATKVFGNTFLIEADEAVVADSVRAVLLEAGLNAAMKTI